jgi:hypothetical protein
MPQYRFYGSLTHKGVTFFVDAPDAATAQHRAALGQYDERDDRSAETVDWEMDLTTCEQNE